jgi:hypothetical protein
MNRWTDRLLVCRNLTGYPCHLCNNHNLWRDPHVTELLAKHILEADS